MRTRKIIAALIILLTITMTPLVAIDGFKKNTPEDDTEDTVIKAITETGDDVILYSDGTWEYFSEPEEKVERKINQTPFKKPETSKDVLNGNQVKYQLWYNKNKWDILSNNINEMAEYSLLHHDKNAYMIIIPEPISIPLENLRNIVMENAKKASKKVKILNEEERNINGLKVIMLHVKAEIQGMSFMYLYYIYSGENASIQLIGFTTEELFPEYHQDIQDFLNGMLVEKVKTNKNPGNKTETGPQKKNINTQEGPVQSEDKQNSTKETKKP